MSTFSVFLLAVAMLVHAYNWGRNGGKFTNGKLVICVFIAFVHTVIDTGVRKLEKANAQSQTQTFERQE